MLFGHFSVDNVIALVAGLISVVLGIANLRWRNAFDRAASSIQRRWGPLGRKIAAEPKARMVVFVAVWFIVFGVIEIGLGLFAEIVSGVVIH